MNDGGQPPQAQGSSGPAAASPAAPPAAALPAAAAAEVLTAAILGGSSVYEPLVSQTRFLGVSSRMEDVFLRGWNMIISGDILFRGYVARNPVFSSVLVLVSGDIRRVPRLRTCRQSDKFFEVSSCMEGVFVSGVDHYHPFRGCFLRICLLYTSPSPRD